MMLELLFAEHVRRRPDALAIVDLRLKRRITFEQMEREIVDTAAWLHAEGFRPGRSILVFLPMSAELYIALLAMIRIGVVAIFVDPSAGPEHLERSCDRWPPDGLLGTSTAHLLRFRLRPLQWIERKYVVEGWVPRTPRWREGPRSPESAVALRSWPDDQPALVTFTSGSTGLPKGAVRTHGFLTAQYLVLAQHLDLKPGDVDLATMPIFPLANLAAGVTTIIPDVDLRYPGQVSGRRIYEIMDEYRASRIVASPALIERVMHASWFAGKGISSLRMVFTGGAPVYPRLFHGLFRLAPNARIVAVYGSTEAEPIAHITSTDTSEDDIDLTRNGRGLLAGLPIPQIRLRIIKDRWGTPLGALTRNGFRREECAAGEPGEIVVAGPHVLGGYLGGIGNDETKFTVDGELWHRTGDAGWLDKAGRLWLLGRCSARIDDQFGRLYPFSIESLVIAHPELARVTAVSLQGERWLVAEPTRTTRRSAAVIEERLLNSSVWANVENVLVVKEIPVDARHNAKINYVALRELLVAAIDRKKAGK